MLKTFITYEFHNCRTNRRTLVVCVSADAVLTSLTPKLLPYDVKQELTVFAAHPQVLVVLVKFTLEQTTKDQRGSRGIYLLFL